MPESKKAHWGRNFKKTPATTANNSGIKNRLVSG